MGINFFFLFRLAQNDAVLARSFKKISWAKTTPFCPSVLKKKKHARALLLLLLPAESSFRLSVEQMVCEADPDNPSSKGSHMGASRLFPWFPRGRATPTTPLWIRHWSPSVL